MRFQSKQLNEIIFLRPLLIVGVIIGHCFAIYSGAWENTIGIEPVWFYKFLNPFFIHLGAFVMVSGYLFAYKKDKYLASSTGNFIFTKFKRIYFPCFIFSILYIVILQPELLVDVKTVIANLLKGTGHLWFLPMIFANFCLLKIFQPAIDKYPITSFICSLALYFGCSVLNVAFLNVVFHYLPFIILGYLLYGKTNIIEKYSFLLLFLWFCVFIVYLFDINRIVSIPLIGTFASFLAGIALLGVTLKISRKYTPIKFINKLNDECYGAYIFQQIIIMLILYHTPLYMYCSTYFLPWVIAVISIFLSFLCSKLLLMTKVGKFLIG